MHSSFSGGGTSRAPTDLYTVFAIGALLIAAFFAVPRLDYDDLSHDELRSYIVAGGAHHSPMDSLAQVWARVAAESPDQAMGFPLVIWLWGQVVGWTEFAARALSFFAGMLTIATTYRLGRDLFHPVVGVSAAMILSTSVYLITLMHYFRVFTLAALLTSITLWCYWRVITRRAGWLAHTGLVLSGIGLVYAHYFVATFLGVLGLYHLLLAPKNKRWWVPVLLLIPVVIVFLPQVPVLLQGYAMNQEKDWLQVQAASPLQIVGIVSQYFSNGVHVLFVGVLGLAAWAATGQRHHRRAFVFVWFVAGGTLVAIIAMNELSGVFEPDRYRYAVGLWVPLVLIAGTGIWQLTQWRLSAGVVALVLWCCVGGWVTWQDELTFSYTASPPWRELVAPVFAYGEPDDVFLYNGRPDSRHGHYTHGIEHRPVVIGNEGEPEVEAAIGDALRVWWGRNLNEDLDRTTAIITQELDERGYVYCDTYLEHPWAWLKLYAKSAVFCPGGEIIANFGDELVLMQAETRQTGEQLVLNTGWRIAPKMPVNTYSLAFVVFAEGENTPAVQQDISLGLRDGPYIPIQVVFNLSDLAPGNYEIHTAVYDWQTLRRLPSEGYTDGLVPISYFSR